MQTFIRILQILFIFLIVNLIGVLIAIQFIDVNKYKDIFADQLSTKLEKPVSIEDASLKFSWSEGVTLELKDLHVEEMLDVALAHVVFDIQTFIKSRAMVIEELKLIRPHVRLVASEEKEKPASEDVDVFVTVEREGAKEGAKEEKSGVPEIGIRRVEIQDGSVTYIDYRKDTPSEVKVQDVDIEIEKFQFDRFFNFALAGSVWSRKQNIQLSGKAMILSVAEQWKLGETKIAIDLGAVELKQVMASYTDMELLKDIDYFAGDLQLSIDEIVYKNNTIDAVQAALSMENGELKHGALKSAFENIRLKTSLQEKNIYLDDIQFSLADGGGVLSGVIQNIFTIPAYALDFDLKGVQIRKLLEQESWPFEVEGKIQGQMNIEGNGFTERQITQSLQGKGTWDVIEGRLIDFNLLREVFDQLDFAPNLKDKVSVKYKEKLAEKDTPLEKIHMDFGIAAGNVVLRKGELAAEGFLHSSKGNLDFNQILDLEASLFISSDLSQELVSAVEEFKYFQDDFGQIVIPFKRYHGNIQKYHPYPDVKGILKGAMKQRAKEEAQKAILKALDMDAPTAVAPVGEEGQKTQPPSPEQVIIENVLDSLGLFE